MEQAAKLLNSRHSNLLQSTKSTSWRDANRCVSMFLFVGNIIANVAVYNALRAAYKALQVR